MSLIWKQQPSPTSYLLGSSSAGSSAANGTELALNGEYGTLTIQATPGAAFPSTGVLNFYGSLDESTSPTYVEIAVTNRNTGAIRYDHMISSTAEALFEANVSGLKRFKATLTNGTTKVMAVRVNGVAMPSETNARLGNVEGAPGAAVPSKAVFAAFAETEGNLRAPHVTNASAIADDFAMALYALASHSLNRDFNGTNWDRRRNNTEGTLLASTSRQSTAATASADQTNYNGRGVVVTVDFSAGTTSTGATVNPQIQYKEYTGSNYVTVASIEGSTSTGLHVLAVYPGASTASFSTSNAVTVKAVSMPLNRTWRFYNGAGAATTQITWSAAYAVVL
jgi:hypothetical protein